MPSLNLGVGLVGPEKGNPPGNARFWLICSILSLLEAEGEDKASMRSSWEGVGTHPCLHLEERVSSYGL